jgi:hypothetical protein
VNEGVIKLSIESKICFRNVNEVKERMVLKQNISIGLNHYTMVVVFLKRISLC